MTHIQPNCEWIIRIAIIRHRRFVIYNAPPNMKYPITITPLIHTPISYLTENLVHLVRFGLVDAEPLVGPRKKNRTTPKHVCMAFASGVN